MQTHLLNNFGGDAFTGVNCGQPEETKKTMRHCD